MLLAILTTVITTFFLVETVGFSVHRLAHWPRAGKIFRDHLHHHAHAYPPGRYQSERYLGDLKTSFLPVFVPIFVVWNILAAALLPWPCFVAFFATSSVLSLFNNYMHDSFHVTTHWLRRYRWYDRLSATHRVHHENVKKNLGIYWYVFDRIFGTYRSPSNR